MGLFSNSSKPQFMGYQEGGNGTKYEMYKSTSAEEARKFLETKTVTQPMYYVIVETPEGNWGKDKEGLYLEKLLPFQTDISKKNCTGSINGFPSLFSLSTALQKISDNFICHVSCGKCGHIWEDGLRYQNLTIVKCPKCKVYNEIDTSNIHAY